MQIFTSKLLLTPAQRIEDAAVCVQDGVVASVGPRSALNAASNQAITDFPDCTLVPGFFDVHIHGSAGCDVMRSGPAEREKMEVFLAKHGVTTYFPTTVTAPLDVTLSALERLAEGIAAAADRHRGRARPVGIHLEGPFLSHAKRGVHPPEDLMKPSVATFDKFWQAARGHVRMMTIAPELEGAEELIAEATKRGVLISIGHSDALIEEARRGVKAGARHATHTFNAMRPLDHREPGILNEVLTNERVSADLIADGIHVHPTIMKLLATAKGEDHLVLITDAISATGMPDGHYLLGTLEVEVRDGKCLRGGTLAGSVLTMDRAVRNLMQFAGVDLQHAIRAAATNPARVAREKNKGVIEAGAAADFVALTPAGEVRATIIAGAAIS
jgi:N-acetylglucosamine-6-phosphate deacetylase